MKNILTKFAFIFAIALLFTACPKPTGDNEITDDSLTEKIASAQGSIDFEDAEIAEDAEVSTAITIKNLKLGGKTLTIKASGTELVNVSNAIITIDQQVGDGDVTLTGCSNITKLVVNGGGSNSIHIKNSKVASVEVKKDAVRVAVEGTSEVDSVVVNAANSKIESDEKIEIKEITVNETIDKVTVKGGTVKKIEVVAFDDKGTPKDAPSSSADQAQTTAQIVIDGAADVQSIEGTTEVTLTEEAVEQGATVIIAPNEQVVPPTVTYENATLTFVNDGSVEGTCFENTNYYYEYIFRVDSLSQEMEQFKIKIYKLEDSIKLYLYSSESIKTPGDDPDTPEIHSMQYLESEPNENSLFFERMYDTKLILSSVGLVKGEFSEERPNSSGSSYSKIFDVKDCGMPVKIVLPDNPKKPVVQIEPTTDGNKITVSNSEYYYERIEIFAAEKDGDTWKPTKIKIFNFDDYNNQNPPSSISKVFLDTFVTPGKEYAYYVDTDEYQSTMYYSSDNNPYTATTAVGGNREILLQAENTTNGITITSSYYPETEITGYRHAIIRTSNDKNTLHINNSKDHSVIDRFVKTGKQYTYSLDDEFWYKDEKVQYYPHSNTCTITATNGLGETMITNSPVVANMTSGSLQLSSTNNTIQFSTAPILGISSIPEDYSINISFMYYWKITTNSTGSESIGYNYVHGATTATCDASSFIEHNQGRTCYYNDFYEVYTQDISTGVTYQYFANDAQFAGLPGTLIIQ